MTHHAKALPAKWASKALLSPAPAVSKTSALNGSAAIALGIALRYLALKRETAPRAMPSRGPRPVAQRPTLRIVT
ncbi:MAG: hypothetical protein K2P94_07730 [Rhodospirillaceae bacterium]|nr:hypothetical protein [Rhodospirillaceae bacterium]